MIVMCTGTWWGKNCKSFMPWNFPLYGVINCLISMLIIWLPHLLYKFGFDFIIFYIGESEVFFSNGRISKYKK